MTKQNKEDEKPKDFLPRSVSEILRGRSGDKNLPIAPGWAIGPCYALHELAFSNDFEVKEWNKALVNKTWNNHADKGPEYISVTHGKLTMICGERKKDDNSIIEKERVDINAGSSVVLRPGLWRKFECTDDATGISIRRPMCTEEQIEKLKLKSDYWYKRLDHTLQHTHIATKLIYIADGAVLGFCYFWIRNLNFEWYAILTAAFPVFLLAVMNYFHACFITNQNSWYNGIDAKLQNLLSQSEVDHSEQLKHKPEQSTPIFDEFVLIKSSHRNLRAIYVAVCGALIIAGFVMISYGIYDWKKTKKDTYSTNKEQSLTPKKNSKSHSKPPFQNLKRR